MTPDQQAEQLDNIDKPKPAAAGIFYLARSRGENQIQLEYYLAETTEHEYLAGSMMDRGLPVEQIRRSLSTEKGVLLPVVPGIQTISLTTTIHPETKIFWLSAWGAAPTNLSVRKIYLERIEAIAEALHEGSKPATDQLKFGKGIDLLTHLVCYDTVSKKYLVE